MNLFTGMTDHEVISTILEFAVFNAFVVLIVLSLAAFYVTSRPRRGRVLTASLWYIAALMFFVVALISTVWSAPAEKAFINAGLPDEPFFDLNAQPMQRFIWGVVFAVAGLVCMVGGALVAGRQKRRLAQEELVGR
jgi:hypothetical protein